MLNVTVRVITTGL